MRTTALLLGLLLLVGCGQPTASPVVVPSALSPSPSPSDIAVTSPSPDPLPSASRDPILISPETYWDGTQVIDGPISIEGYVVEITDGDTFVMCISRGYSCELTDDTVVIRLVQIDTPEDNDVKECYGATASLELADLLVEGAPVIAVTDPDLDQEDQYGRMLAWVWSPLELVNLSLVTRGAAAPYFYQGARGAFAARLESEALTARAARRGLWGACPGTPYAPTNGVSTGPAN
ncbi:MAG: thermonuclease family protein [Chloroflexi bacterium]|nr:thermonuclease family protein [Chloroflexota bacterium]